MVLLDGKVGEDNKNNCVYFLDKKHNLPIFYMMQAKNVPVNHFKSQTATDTRFCKYNSFRRETNH